MECKQLIKEVEKTKQLFFFLSFFLTVRGSELLTFWLPAQYAIQCATETQHFNSTYIIMCTFSFFAAGAAERGYKYIFYLIL